MSKNGPYPIKNSPYLSKQVRLLEMFHNEQDLSLEKVIPMEKFANHYKMVFKKKQPTRVVISLVFLTCVKKPSQQKNVVPLNGITIHYRNMLQKKRAQMLVVLQVSITIVWWPWVHIHMCITILWLKMEWRQVWERSLYTKKIEVKSTIHAHVILNYILPRVK